MNVVIIVAGGSGLRMGSEIPKQFLPVAGKPILMHTLRRFNDYDKSMHIVLVLPKSQREYWDALCREHSFDIEHAIVDGGETRYHSVLNGLNYTRQHLSSATCIGVHDGVRPLVSAETLRRTFTEASEYGSAIPVMPAIESVRFIDETDKGVSHAVDRRRVVLVQTPQVFRAQMLFESYGLGYRETFTDDASVCEAAGHVMHLAEGNKENVKITTPDDLLLAEMMLR